MVGIVGELAVDCLQHTQGLRTDVDCFGQHLFSNLVDGVDDQLPCVFEGDLETLACVANEPLKLVVTIAVRLFAVGREEIREPRSHVSDEMLDDNCDRVGILSTCVEEPFVVDLLDCLYGQVLIVPKPAARFFEVELAGSRFAVASCGNFGSGRIRFDTPDVRGSTRLRCVGVGRSVLDGIGQGRNRKRQRGGRHRLVEHV